MPDVKTDRPDRAICIGYQEMAARMGAVTGKGLSDLIREHP